MLYRVRVYDELRAGWVVVANYYLCAGVRVFDDVRAGWVRSNRVAPKATFC